MTTELACANEKDKHIHEETKKDKLHKKDVTHLGLGKYQILQK